MRKQFGRKLTLSRETMRNLSERDMGRVAGGFSITCAGGGCSGTDTIQQSDCVHVTCGQICATLVDC